MKGADMNTALAPVGIQLLARPHTGEKVRLRYLEICHSLE
jgi:hypothetical protein